jgi:hypothetical protein
MAAHKQASTPLLDALVPVVERMRAGAAAENQKLEQHHISVDEYEALYRELRVPPGRVLTISGVYILPYEVLSRDEAEAAEASSDWRRGFYRRDFTVRPSPR